MLCLSLITLQANSRCRMSPTRLLCEDKTGDAKRETEEIPKTDHAQEAARPPLDVVAFPRSARGALRGHQSINRSWMDGFRRFGRWHGIESNIFLSKSRHASFIRSCLPGKPVAVRSPGEACDGSNPGSHLPSSPSSCFRLLIHCGDYWTWYLLPVICK